MNARARLEVFGGGRACWSGTNNAKIWNYSGSDEARGGKNQVGQVDRAAAGRDNVAPDLLKRHDISGLSGGSRPVSSAVPSTAAPAIRFTNVMLSPSPSISFLRWRVDGLKLGVMHRSRVISGMGSSGDTGQRDRDLGGRD